MKKLPLGIQNFKKIIEGDYVYADKTRHIYNLLNDVSYYFLSRPRRFGKSLLLDTIAEVFNGDRELFKGLWIYDSDYKFKKHPVVRLDMSKIPNKNPETLEYALLSELKKLAKTEKLDIDSAEPAILFCDLIENLFYKYNQRVVVLIDEYDKPILDHIDDIKTAGGNRKALSGFYGILKSMDPYLRMTFITGVTKFSKTSIFSVLNNLKDITMVKKYSDICGIPISCLDECFGEHIAWLNADDRFKQYDSIALEILRWYDGYSWDGENRVLNPFSLLSFFSYEKFECFWYSSGTPGFLIEILKKKPESFLTLKNLELSERALDTFEIEKMQIEPLLFQSGYLTVKELQPGKGVSVYRVDMPNHEVREAFYLNIISGFTEQSEAQTESMYRSILTALQDGKHQNILILLKSLFSSIPYTLHVDVGAYYHSIFYAVMTLLGFDIDAEVSSSRGRIDAVLELSDKIYIMEFKFIKCPKDASDAEKKKLFDAALSSAMEQINSRGYNDKYMNSRKTIYKTAFAFLGRDEIEMKIKNVVNI